MTRLLIIAALCGCTATGGDAVFVTPDWAPVDAGPDVPLIEDDTVEPDWDTEGAGPLTGYFAVEAYITALVAGSFEFQTRQILLARFVQHGTTLRQRLTLCALDLPSVDGIVDLTIPPEVGALIRGIDGESEGEFLSSPDVGATWNPAPLIVLLGADVDGQEGPLPGDDAVECTEDPAFPCLTDPDEDGDPGVPVQADVALCERNPQRLDIALRVVISLEGTVGPNHDTLNGDLDPVLEFTVVGISDPCLEAAKALTAQAGEDSTFKAYRVDGATDGSLNLDADSNGAVSCSELLAGLPEPEDEP